MNERQPKSMLARSSIAPVSVAIKPLIMGLCMLVVMFDGYDTQSMLIARDIGIGITSLGPIFAAGLFGLMLRAMWLVCRDGNLHFIAGNSVNGQTILMSAVFFAGAGGGVSAAWGQSWIADRRPAGQPAMARGLHYPRCRDAHAGRRGGDWMLNQTPGTNKAGAH